MADEITQQEYTPTELKDLPDFEIDADGNIKVMGELPQHLQPQETQEQVQDQTQSVSSTTDNWELKFNELNGKFEALQVQNQQLLNALSGKLPQQEQSLEDKIGSVNTDDPKEIIRVIADSMKTQIEKAITPYKQQIENMAAQLQVHNLAATYGQEFASRVPVIQEIMKAAPNLTLEQAFQISVATTKANGNNPAKNPGTKPANQLVQKSNNLKLDSSESVSQQVVSQKREIKSVKDAFLAALEEHNQTNSR
jgi:hypothetical protein